MRKKSRPLNWFRPGQPEGRSHSRLKPVSYTHLLGNSADAFIILRAQERGLTVIGVLAMLLAFNLVYSAVAGPAGRLSDRIGRPRLILAGWAVYAVIYLGLALAGAAWQVVALFIAYGIYHGLVEGNARAFVADLAGSCLLYTSRCV